MPTGKGRDMDELTKTIATRGDLAHLALFLWATSATGLCLWLVKELSAASRRFDSFVHEIASLNQLFNGKK